MTIDAMDSMNPLKHIAIETSSRQGSIAIGVGAQLTKEVAFPANEEHAKALLPALAELLKVEDWSPNEVGLCSISIGPGSFTGIRIAAAFGRHFALATGAKLCAVPTLDVIAANALQLPQPPNCLVAMLPAKRDEVFAAVFQLEDGRYCRTCEAYMATPEKVLNNLSTSAAITGEGAEAHRRIIEERGNAILESSLWVPKASEVYKLGWQMAVEGQYTPSDQLVPLYLRRPEAEELWEKRQSKETKP